MPVFTVHQPPPRKPEQAAPPERFVFVRDGFYFWAFLFGGLWMIWHRMWLVLLLYVIGAGGFVLALRAAGLPDGVIVAVAVLIALLVGFEAATLRRWSLRRWTARGLVVAPNLEEAERRFFVAWAEHVPPAPSPSVPHSPPSAPPAADSGVIGLFPEPQPRA